jgi:hypothetical protein
MKTKPFILTYGRSGIGKSVDCVYSFPNALYISVPGALQCAEFLCGYTPAQIDVADLGKATEVLVNLAKGGAKYDTVVVDDISFLVEQTVRAIQGNAAQMSLPGWGKVYQMALDFRKTARYLDMTVVINCWERCPHTTQKGEYIRGGPKFPGQLPEMFSSMADMVLRCDIDSRRKPWTGIYRCENSKQYIMKDRLSKCYSMSPIPMNLGEILRSSGIEVSRLKSLAWQEEVVESLSTSFQETSDPLSLANTTYSSMLAKGIAAPYVKWTLRDAMDRAVIRQALSQSQQSFIAV